MELHSAGDNALILYLGDETSAEVAARVQASCVALTDALGEDLIDLIPSYASILIVYDPMRTDHYHVRARVLACLQQLGQGELSEGRLVELPAYYSPESGEDLENLAVSKNISIDEVIKLHSDTEYRVYAIGFAPGFAYLGQVDERLAAPRLSTPRLRVPAGAVAIADRQTAVYPAPSPGGWNLVGRCPIPMFDPTAEPTMPVAVGDRVRFRPVDRQEFLDLGGNLE